MIRPAIIGTGIAGLGCAHFLQSRFDLTRRSLECGDMSPLSAGDSSPSKSRTHPIASHHSHRAILGQEDLEAGTLNLPAHDFPARFAPRIWQTNGDKRMASPCSPVPIRLTSPSPPPASHGLEMPN